MNIAFNVTGPKRKELVRTISEILGCDVVYEGAPTFAYSVSHFKIDKNGTLAATGDDTSEEVKGLLSALKERGYIPETVEGERTVEADKIIIKMPRIGYSEEVIDNLKKIVASKEKLFKKALGADSLPIEVTSDTITFPWFTASGTGGETDAYAHFVVALCQMAKNQKRITAKEKELENDKFTMRLFLIRLGFVGPDYKAARTILLKNLTGNSSFKSGQRPIKADTAENSVASISQEASAVAQTEVDKARRD